jgi:hypothetical protein
MRSTNEFKYKFKEGTPSSTKNFAWGYVSVVAAVQISNKIKFSKSDYKWLVSDEI